ncbi:MAG: phosphoheptose isomerase [Desulfobulbus propionicus]|nr:MAG: phosphoheptose isomerase [Desulfobulbus propionicus]
MKTLLQERLALSIAAKQAFAAASLDDLLTLTQWIKQSLDTGGKLLLFGNGGSAADAQHVAAEFVNRFLINRRPLPAIALTTDTSTLTAIGNDFSYEVIFAKQVEALGKPEDVALGISTSGTSANVVKAMEAAKAIGMKTAGLTGGTENPGGALADLCDIILNVPSDHTQHIQETHLWIEHMICEIVEKQLFPST